MPLGMVALFMERASSSADAMAPSGVDHYECQMKSHTLPERPRRIWPKKLTSHRAETREPVSDRLALGTIVSAGGRPDRYSRSSTYSSFTGLHCCSAML